MSSAVRYITISSVVVLSVTAMASALCLYSDNAGAAHSVYPFIILGLFFAMMNVASMTVRTLLAGMNGRTLTTFYLADKTFRFVLSLVVIGVAIYLSKAARLEVSLFSFVLYLVALAFEVGYFVTMEKVERTQKRLENAK